MSDDPDARELAAVADDLAETLAALQAELEGPPEPPRGPLGLPRPPTPREALRFADQVAIPATIAVLEANVKLLRALQRAIRLADTEREVRDRGTAATERAVSASRAGLSRLERALDDLQAAVQESDLPSDETARDLLQDARRLRAEIDDRLADAQQRADESATGTGAGGDGGDSATGGEGGDRDEAVADEPVQVDVEGELESLKQRYGEDDGSEDGSETSEGGDADGTDADEDGTA